MAVTEVAPRAQLPRLLAAVRADGSPVQFDEHLSVYGTPPVHLGGRLIDVVDPPAGPAPALDRLDLGALPELGWRPEVALEDGMSRTLQWLLSPRA